MWGEKPQIQIKRDRRKHKQGHIASDLLLADQKQHEVMSVFKDYFSIPTLCLAAYVCFIVTALGVTAGAHRLWSHRSYKAKLPLRIFLAAANSMAFQV